MPKTPIREWKCEGGCDTVIDDRLSRGRKRRFCDECTKKRNRERLMIIIRRKSRMKKNV